MIQDEEYIVYVPTHTHRFPINLNNIIRSENDLNLFLILTELVKNFIGNLKK